MKSPSCRGLRQRKLNGVAAKKIEPQFFAVCLLLFALAFNVR